MKVQSVVNHLLGISHDVDTEWLCEECNHKKSEAEVFYVLTTKGSGIILCSQCLFLLHSMTSPLPMLIKANINIKV